MPQGERPRERLRDYGPRYLSNAELIAILLRTGVQSENVLAMSNRLLSRFGGLDGLGRSSFAEPIRPYGHIGIEALQVGNMTRSARGQWRNLAEMWRPTRG